VRIVAVIALLVGCKGDGSDPSSSHARRGASCGNGIVETGEACDTPGPYVDECPDGWAVCRVCRPDCTVGLAEVVLQSARERDLPGVISITWSDGLQASYGYDAKGHLERKQLGAEQRTYRWDDRGRLVYEDGPEHVTRYEYVEAGRRRTTRIISENPLGEAPRVDERVDEYDAAGRLVISTEAGRTTRMSYDTRGLLVSLDSPLVKFTYAYDDHGRLALRRSDDGSTTFGYDASGRLVEETLDVGLGGSGNTRTTYAYGANGLLARTLVETSDGKTTRQSETIYRYDADGNLTEKTVDGVVTRYTYDVALVKRWRAEAPWRARVK